jgi:hypothetical protein
VVRRNTDALRFRFGPESLRCCVWGIYDERVMFLRIAELRPKGSARPSPLGREGF